MVLSTISKAFFKMLLPKVKDVITSDLTTLDARVSLMDAVQAMMKDNVSSMVFTRDGKPAGILTRRDLMTKCFFEQSYFQRTTAGDVMSKPLITIGPNANILEAYELMMQKGIRRLVVIEDGKVIGRVRLDDIKHLASETEATAFYRAGYFILGVLVTIGVIAIIIAL